MGSSAIKTIAMGLIVMTCAVYFAPDSTRTLRKVLITVGVPDNYVKSILTFLTLTDDSLETIKEPTKTAKSERLFTPQELKKYDGSPDSKGLCLAILGEVFDVEKGAQHYRPGGGYAFFTGRDASRAYITGDFSEEGLIDDVSGLDESSLAGMEDWLSFYKEEYKPVGKVIGRYYDQNGKPTKELESVREKIEHGKKSKWTQDNEKELFPPCNSEWSQEKGSKVWCSKKSGGIERDWVGVPRELHRAGKDPRCVCVKNYGPSSSASSSKQSNRGDLDHPELKEYSGCPPDAETCKVNHP